MSRPWTVDWQPSDRGPLPRAAQVLSLVAAYVGFGVLGLTVASVDRFATLIWPPTGLSLAALLLGGYRLWPAVTVSAVVTNLIVGAPPLVALGIAVGNTGEALVGAMALRAVPGFNPSLERVRDVVALITLAGMASTLLSATVGVACLTLGGLIPLASAGRAWSVWWTGDLLGNLVVAPLVLTWAHSRRVRLSPAAIAESALLGVFLVGSSTILFLQPPEAVSENPILLPYVLFLPLIWAALRFGVRGAATGMFLVACAAVWGTCTGHGEFVRISKTESLFAGHIFLIAASLASLVLGAAACELREKAAVLSRIIEEMKRVEEGRAELLSREQAARAEAQSATRAKDEFLAVLSHELRTPLQSMLGWTQMLNEPGLDPRTVKKGKEAIERNLRLQMKLIEDLLDISRIVAGKLRLATQRVDLAELVESAVSSARVAVEAKALRVEAAIERLDHDVLGDPVRLQQVVSNLLSNAVKFTPSGGRIGVRLRREGLVARLVVEDSGCGISPEFLARVFDRFGQEDSSTARSHGGLGLGLTIVRHLVELQGGTVSAASPGRGRGATFTMTLPLINGEHAVVAATPRRPPPAPGDHVTLAGTRVLVVDDDPDACDLLETVLRACGAEVHAVQSTRAALAALASFHPDVLMSDIGMPEEDGYALVGQMRAREARSGGHVRAVALTAFASQADREQALAMGFEAHLAKPASPGEVVTTVARLTGRDS